MSQPKSENFPGFDTSAPLGLSSHSESSLAEILQKFCTERRSGQVTFRSTESYGYVFLQQGQAVHAMCGTVEGEEAVYLMLSWPPGSFVLNDDILSHKRTISATWEQLLLEGARRADLGAVNQLPQQPVTTASPPISTRAKDHQPKLIVSHGDAPSLTVELQSEYTHLGRADDNEISLPEPSISSRHCLFILSGPDVIVRDLNSSNGTYVNGEQVSEATLRPGDNIQVGVIDIKFVPGVRRPKLTGAASPPAGGKGLIATSRVPAPRAETTLKPPAYLQRETTRDRSPADTAFATGSAPISYDQLAPDAPQSTPPAAWRAPALVILLILAIGVSLAYFFLLRP